MTIDINLRYPIAAKPIVRTHRVQGVYKPEIVNNHLRREYRVIRDCYATALGGSMEIKTNSNKFFSGNVVMGYESINGKRVPKFGAVGSRLDCFI